MNMDTIEGLNDIVVKAFDLVADGWNNNNGIDGFCEFTASITRHSSEEILEHWTGNGITIDSWIREFYNIWFGFNSTTDRFWQVYLKLDPKNKKKFLTGLSEKQVKRNYS